MFNQADILIFKAFEENYSDTFFPHDGNPMVFNLFKNMDDCGKPLRYISDISSGGYMVAIPSLGIDIIKNENNQYEFSYPDFSTATHPELAPALFAILAKLLNERFNADLKAGEFNYILPLPEDDDDPSDDDDEPMGYMPPNPDDEYDPDDDTFLPTDLD